MLKYNLWNSIFYFIFISIFIYFFVAVDSFQIYTDHHVYIMIVIYYTIGLV